MLPFTKDTCLLLGKNNIAYTVATGPTMLLAQSILAEHNFNLPQIYNDGVTIWDPKTEQLTLENLLDNSDISIIVDAAASQGITPFVHAVDNQQHFIFHAITLHDEEKKLVRKHCSYTKAKLSSDRGITHKKSGYEYQHDW
jgi:hydroxymethylpyrimidine pyrophosphatase-like HAD family hydrolase|tara:strand:+ start:185 stop:607 length:423 start_codon:yes stop_codon:yes gene_type:complete